jgi:serine/threonine protein kinase
MKLRGSRQLQPVIGLTFVGSGGQVAPAIVAEHFAGGNLHDIVHLGATPLDIDVRLQLLTDIATGLKILHSQDPPIVHPTISPYNVLLDDDFRAVLTQYGYPIVLGAVNGGFMQYAAPEVLTGEEPTAQSDVYSWAMIAIEILERRQLYLGVEAGAVLTGVRDEWLRPIFGQEYPAGLEDLLVECTAKNPIRRPTSAEVLVRLKEISEELKSQAQSAAYNAAGASARELLHSIFPTQVANQLEMGKRVVRLWPTHVFKYIGTVDLRFRYV